MGSRYNKLQTKVERYSEAASKASELKDQLKELSSAYKDISGQFDVVNVKYKVEQVMRKKLTNELEDMKGHVRCYARVRPFTKGEVGKDKPVSAIKIHDNFSLTLTCRGNEV